LCSHVRGPQGGAPRAGGSNHAKEQVGAVWRKNERLSEKTLERGRRQGGEPRRGLPQPAAREEWRHTWKGAAALAARLRQGRSLKNECRPAPRHQAEGGRAPSAGPEWGVAATSLCTEAATHSGGL
jgi:hypothetical protein